MSDPQGADTTAPIYVPLSSERHGRLKLKTDIRALNAREAVVVPLALVELPDAAADYPIVFVGEPSRIAAVVGVETGRNAFVDAEGRWATDCYIPAAIRREPFVLAPRPDGPATELVVMIDERHDTLSTDAGDPLFEDGQPSKRTQDLIEFCRNLAAAAGATDEFVAAVEQHGLLHARVASFTRPDGSPGQVDGMRIIDPDRLAALPEAAVLDWHRRGWLTGAALHLASQRRWSALVRRAERAGTPERGDA